MRLKDLPLGAVGKYASLRQGPNELEGTIRDLRVHTMEERGIAQRPGQGDVYIVGYGLTLDKWSSDDLTGEEEIRL